MSWCSPSSDMLAPGQSTIAEALKNILGSPSLQGGAYEAEVLKARVVIGAWAEQSGATVASTGRPDLGAVERYQDLGDEIRLTSKDNAAVAKGQRTARAEVPFSQ
jgi:hypothetical protein